MLELKNVSYKVNGKLILDNINLKIDKNSFSVITGPNGSGKSTLIKIIMGIIIPDEGSIIFNGKDITNLPIYDRNKKGIAFGFQNIVLFKGIKVKDLISDIKLLNYLGLDESYYEREINNKLSGGELKRIEIATVLDQNKKFNIFDEPEAGIDIWSFDDLIDIFYNLKEEGKSLLIVSHQHRLFKLCDNIILLEKGKIIDQGGFIKMKHYFCKGGRNCEQ